MQLFRLHPAIKPSKYGPVVGGRPVHLQQSDLDGACGPHCAIVALMILGLVHRDDLDTLPRSRKKRLTALWRRSERNYFRGTYPEQLRSVLAPYGKELDCSIERDECVARVINVLHATGLGIMNISNDDFNHWVLVVGSGGTEVRSRYRPASLLILDPSHATLPMSAWNAMLSVRSGRLERHTYNTADGRVRVNIDSFVSLRRINHGQN